MAGRVQFDPAIGTKGLAASNPASDLQPPGNLEDAPKAEKGTFSTFLSNAIGRNSSADGVGATLNAALRRGATRVAGAESTSSIAAFRTVAESQVAGGTGAMAATGMFVTLANLETVKEEILAKSQQDNSTILNQAKRHSNDHAKRLEVLINTIEASSANVKDEIKASINSALAEVTDVSRMRNELEGLRSGVETLQEQMRNDVKRAIPRIQDDVEEIRQKLADDFFSTRKQTETFGAALSRLSSDVADYKSSAHVAGEDVGSSLKEFAAFSSRAKRQLVDLGKAEEALRTRLNQHVEDSKANFEKYLNDANMNLATLGADSNARLQVLEQDAGESAQATAEIHSIPVRRVDWIVRNASQFAHEANRTPIGFGDYGQAKQERKPLKCWFSPVFEASGAGGLQLELQIFKRECEGEWQDMDSEPTLECAVRLWARTGTHMRLKLYFGDHVAEFQHAFDGCSPCAMKRFPLKDGVRDEADTLCMGMEVLEFFQSKENAAVPLLSEQCTHASSGGECGENTARGSLCMLRYLCPGTSNKLDAVEQQLNLVQSRLLSRVEWALQDASLMPDLFPQGTYICSPVFTAGGIDGLQLIFFPSGEDGATACWCSLYLYYPGRTQLQCQLSVGKHRRDLSTSQISKDRPGLFGRANFSIYQSSVDRATDSLLLTLEICDVQCTGTQVLACEPVPRAVPWPQNLAAPSIVPPVATLPAALEDLENASGSLAETSEMEALSSWSHPQLFEHTARLHGRAGRMSFQDVKKLPSIFTVMRPQSLDDFGQEDRSNLWNYKPKVVESAMPEGYFKSTDLRVARPDMKLLASMQSAPVPPRGELTPLKLPHGSPRPESRDRRGKREPLATRAELESSPQRPSRTVPKNEPQNLVKRAQARQDVDFFARNSPFKGAHCFPSPPASPQKSALSKPERRQMEAPWSGDGWEEREPGNETIPTPRTGARVSFTGAEPKSS